MTQLVHDRDEPEAALGKVGPGCIGGVEVAGVLGGEAGAQVAPKLLNELSAGGTVEMPIQDMFFGSYFGSFRDKYGINWMINYQTNKKE
jgi:hypothetical protein